MTNFPDALILKLCSAPGLWEHSVNTFLLCRAALDVLAVPNGPARREILLAALCHDLGKAEWPEAVARAVGEAAGGIWGLLKGPAEHAQPAG
jgi:hypothetical protein